MASGQKPGSLVFSKTMTQPAWIVAANLGDVNPLDYGGSFILIDGNGVYCPKLWIFEPIDDSDDTQVTFNRILLEVCHIMASGEIGDNNYHPTSVAWFGDLRQLSLAISYGDYKNLALHLSSDNILERASAYRLLIDYHGAANFGGEGKTLAYKQAKKTIDRLQKFLKSKRVFDPSIV
jgi:hypothetical protein